jgi:hypothetical protein
MAEIMGQMARIEMENVFGDSFLGETEGHINTLNELQSALSQVAETYNTLGNAQKEQNRYGKLSVQTVISLLASNINYA